MVYSLRKGDSGQEVKRLQDRLGLLVDGSFGPKTDAGVRIYQKARGLVVDGIAGPKTLGSLDIEVLRGIDVSAWNGNILWDRVAASGVRYAWAKITEGQTHTNKPYRKNMDGCHQNGITVGGYHFGRPDTGIDQGIIPDAIAEANHFLSKINPLIRPGDLVPVLDLEAGMKTDDQHNVDWCLAWLDYVESQIGAKPMVYTGGWAVELYVKRASKSSLEELAKYPLWWARYLRKTGGPSSIDPGSGYKMNPWDEWAVWQWTSKGQVDGIKGKCDLNWMAGGKLSSLLIP